MSTYYPPYKSSGQNVKVELDLSNYTTKDDVKNITHVDVNSYATKTNLAALKTEVDKIDTDKLKTVPDDLAKLSNVVKNEVVKKTAYNTLKNKVDAIDTSKFVSRTKFTTDTNSLDNKIDQVEKKIPDISGLATKSSVTRLITEQEDYTDKVKKKIHDISGLASKAELTAVENEIPDVSGLATTSALTAVENKIPDITNLITKTDFDTKLKSVSDRVTNNKSKDILLDNELKKLKTRVDSSEKVKPNDVQKEINFNRGFFYYLQQSYLVYECKVNSFAFNNTKITNWRSTGIFNYSDYYTMNGIEDTKKKLPKLKIDDETYVYLQGSYFQQNNVIVTNNKNAISIYIDYKLDPISSTRDTTFTIQNALFGAMEIHKNADTSKYKYKGYGICFDEGGSFSIGNINNGRNVLIFGVDESSVVHSNNKANNIYVMGDGIVQGINDTTLYAEKIYSQNFTQPSKKFILSLHYNGDDNYLFVNGKQELKFKEKLCIGNLSDKWTTSESEKTELYGNIYDFVIDYKPTVGVDPIHDMHKYLMTKHNISP